MTHRDSREQYYFVLQQACQLWHWGGQQFVLNGFSIETEVCSSSEILNIYGLLFYVSRFTVNIIAMAFNRMIIKYGELKC